MELYQFLKLQKAKKAANVALQYPYISGTNAAMIAALLDEIEKKETSINRSRSLIQSPTLTQTAKEMHRRAISTNEDFLNSLRIRLCEYITTNFPQFANLLKL